MTSTEKEQLAKMLAVRAEISGKTISTQALVMMVEDMADLPFLSVISTLQSWGRTEKGFPYPADVRAKLSPEMDDSDDAQEVAASVIAAISKYGYTNPGMAQEFIGSLGWEVVTRMGGWKHLCETCTHESQNTLRAQIRNFAETVSKRAKRGELDIKPALPIATEVKSIINGAFIGIDYAEGDE